jgi:hypothetical protein
MILYLQWDEGQVTNRCEFDLPYGDKRGGMRLSVFHAVTEEAV